MTTIRDGNGVPRTGLRSRQVCDHCGGRFGMVTHRWWGNKFCKRKCKDASCWIEPQSIAGAGCWASSREVDHCRTRMEAVLHRCDVWRADSSERILFTFSRGLRA
jgi:hypothetical protein